MNNKMVFNKTVILTLFIISLNSFLICQDARWEKLPFYGGQIVDIDYFNAAPEISISASKRSGIYRSTDGGKEWQKVFSSQVHELKINNEDIAFAATEDGLLKSTDQGINWTKIIDVETWQIECGFDGWLAADTMTQLRTSYNSVKRSPWLLSKDNGDTWEEWAGTALDTTFQLRLNLDNIKRGSIFFHKNGTILLTEDSYILRANVSNPTNWEYLGTIGADYFLAVPYFDDMEADSETIWAYSEYHDFHPMGFIPGGLFQSNDLGETWTSINGIESVTSFEQKGNVIYAGNNEGDIIKYDITTGDVSELANLGGRVNSIQINNSISNLCVTSDAGIYQSDDGGSNFYKSDKGIMEPFITSVEILKLDENKERILTGTKDAGIWYSDDNGDTWELSNSEIYTVPNMIVASKANPKIIFAGGDLIYSSSNYGDSWQKVNLNYFSYYGWYSRCNDIDINNGKVLINYYDHSLDHYLGNKLIYGIETYGTWNWGESYDEYAIEGHCQFNGTSNKFWISKGSHKDGPTLKLVEAYSDSVYDSISTKDSTSADIWLVDSNLVFLYYNDFLNNSETIYSSNNKGETWSTFDIGPSNYRYPDRNIGVNIGKFLLSPSKGKIFFITPGLGIYYTNTSNILWKELNDGFDNLEIFDLEFSSIDTTEILATSSSGIYVLDKSTNTKPFTESISRNHVLHTNYPNPFNPSTNISYQIADNSGKNVKVKLSVYNALGQKVAVLIDREQRAGNYEVSFDGIGLSSGVYFYRIYVGGWSDSKKMTLLK